MSKQPKNIPVTGGNAESRKEKHRVYASAAIAVVAVAMLLTLRLTLIWRFDALMYIGDAAAVLLVLTCVFSEIVRSPLNGKNLSVQEKHDVVMQARERIRGSEDSARKQLYRRHAAVTRQMMLMGALGILAVLGHVWSPGAVLVYPVTMQPLGDTVTVSA